MIYIGIDPGASGGIAHITESGLVLNATPMPATEQDILAAVFPSVMRVGPSTCRAALEHVWSTPGQGGAFKFGRSVGHCEMALTAARIPFDKVLPRAWQKEMGVVYPKGATDTQKKNITKRRAQQLFPSLFNITHAIADALLIAEYCRRTERGRHGKAQGGTRGESREEFEKDRFGETGERLAAEAVARRAGEASREGATAPRHGEPARQAARQTRERRG